MQHHMNSPGALNVKAGVKTRELDSRGEHCMSRESPGYYFGKRVLLPECSSRWSWSDVFSTCTSPRSYINKGMLDLLFEEMYKTTTEANGGLLPGTRRRNHPTSRPPIKSTGVEIELTKRTAPG